MSSPYSVLSHILLSSSSSVSSKQSVVILQFSVVPYSVVVTQYSVVPHFVVILQISVVRHLCVVLNLVSSHIQLLSSKSMLFHIWVLSLEKTLQLPHQSTCSLVNDTIVLFLWLIDNNKSNACESVTNTVPIQFGFWGDFWLTHDGLMIEYRWFGALHGLKTNWRIGYRLALKLRKNGSQSVCNKSKVDRGLAILDWNLNGHHSH